MKSWLAPWTRACLLVLMLVAVSSCRSATPDDLDPANVVVGYLTQPSWVGGAGGIVLDDGSGYSFDVLADGRRFAPTLEARRKLLQAVDDADFFDLPERLHNDDITDGTEKILFVATASKQHWSANYMHDSSDHRELSDALAQVVQTAASGAPAEPVELVVREVEAYLARGDHGEKGAAVSRWLEQSKVMIANTPPH